MPVTAPSSELTSRRRFRVLRPRQYGVSFGELPIRTSIRAGFDLGAEYPRRPVRQSITAEPVVTACRWTSTSCSYDDRAAAAGDLHHRTVHVEQDLRLRPRRRFRHCRSSSPFRRRRLCGCQFQRASATAASGRQPERQRHRHRADGWRSSGITASRGDADMPFDGGFKMIAMRRDDPAGSAAASTTPSEWGSRDQIWTGPSWTAYAVHRPVVEASAEHILPRRTLFGSATASRLVIAVRMCRSTGSDCGAVIHDAAHGSSALRACGDRVHERGFQPILPLIDDEIGAGKIF